MVLTITQCELLTNMVNASIKMAMDSGIPIGVEFYKDIDKIKEKLSKELSEAYREGRK